MVTKPTVTTEWATTLVDEGGGTFNKATPELGVRSTGQSAGLPVDRQSHNYILDANHQWKTYFEELTDQFLQGATETNIGVTQLATESELEAGTNTLKVVPVATLSSYLQRFARRGYIPVVGGGQLEINSKYLITDSSTYLLPDTTGLEDGDDVEMVRFGSPDDVTPTPVINVHGGDGTDLTLGSNGETVEYYNTATGILDETKPVVEYSISAEITFLFNETSGNWEL